jgi:hypothetical protein
MGKKYHWTSCDNVEVLEISELMLHKYWAERMEKLMATDSKILQFRK